MIFSSFRFSPIQNPKSDHLTTGSVPSPVEVATRSNRLSTSFHSIPPWPTKLTHPTPRIASLFSATVSRSGSLGDASDPVRTGEIDRGRSTSSAVIQETYEEEEEDDEEEEEEDEDDDEDLEDDDLRRAMSDRSRAVVVVVRNSKCSSIWRAIAESPVNPSTIRPKILEESSRKCDLPL